MIAFLDVHARGCSCTYCTGNGIDKGLHYGLNIPPDWRAFNSWFVVKFWPGCYWRFTHGLRFLRRPIDSGGAKK